MIDHDKNVLMSLRIKQSEKTLSETSFLIENKLLALQLTEFTTQSFMQYHVIYKRQFFYFETQEITRVVQQKLY